MNITADVQLQRIRQLMPTLLDIYEELLARADASSGPLLFVDAASRVPRVSSEVLGDPARWYFIGDLHGDFFALHTLLEHLDDAHPGCRIVFLGDLVDRGDMHVECLFLLLDWARRHPGRLAWIAGNHDLAFRYAEESGRFQSVVQPAEFLDFLNADGAMAGFHRAVGRLFVALTARLPRALLFPDGLLATHGGFPLVDLQAEGARAETPEAFEAWLNSPACLKDFTWTRIHRKRRAIPDRHGSDSQYGFLDFEALCAMKPAWFPVSRLLTGHTHPPEGVMVHATYTRNPAMTLIGFGYDETRMFPDCYDHYRPQLYLARHRAGALPDVVAVPVDGTDLRRLYPQLDAVPQSAADGAAGASVIAEATSPEVSA